MAGAGYKLFNTGDVLTAAQVNTYLQEQTVMVFADAAARTTALSGVLAEGMMSYLKSTDSVEVYNGSAWVSVSSDQTPLTTKGDLFTFTTTDARLAVGNNGETLVADSSASTGLRWQGSQTAGKNAIINGGMDIWQRGTTAASITSNTYSPADRWAIGMGTTGRTISRQTSSLTGIQYALRIQRDSGNSANTFAYLAYSLESADSYRFAGKTVTLSFYARAGANYSASGSQLSLTFLSSTGTDQNILNSFSGSATVASGTPTLTTSWQRFTFTGSVASTATQLGFYLISGWSGTAGANDWFEVTGVQLELGSVATEFSRAGATLAGELAACQRYYLRINGSAAENVVSTSGISWSTSNSSVFVQHPVPLRVAATSVEYASLNLADFVDYNRTVTSVTISTGASNTLVTALGVGASSVVQYRPAWLRTSANTGYLGLSAEL